MERTHDTGTLILQGISDGVFWSVVGALCAALILVGLFAVWRICRNDALRRKADRERLRVRTFLEINGVATPFDMKEAA